MEGSSLHSTSSVILWPAGKRCLHCRHSQELLRDSQILPVHPCHLADLLHAVPALLKTLSPKDWAVLSASSRELRQEIHSSVKAVSICITGYWNKCNVKQILEGDWPQLALIKERRESGPYRQTPHPTADGNSRLIASLIAHGDSVSFSVCIVSPTQYALGVDERQPDQRKTIAAALSYPCRPGWYAYNLSASFHSLGLDILAQMSQVEWPQLHFLDLKNNRLGATAMVHLVRGRWPELKWLNPTGNQLDGAAMQIFL